MKSIQITTYNKNIIRALLGLKLQEKETGIPGNNEVLVKMHAAPCNPSDIAFIQGTYNIVKKLPAVPGFEGSGMVVETGKNTGHLLGKKISAFVQSDTDGTWAEYFVVNADDLIALQDEMDLDQAACFTVNPFTAYGLMDIAGQRESKAIVQNAAGSQVAAFVRMMARENGVKVIDIVRKKEHVGLLESQGAQHVLCENERDFEEQLNKLSKTLQATTAFDAVGGRLAGTIFNALVPDAELVVYGGLSGKPIENIHLMGPIFQNKIISGFNLIDWKADLGGGEFEKISEKLQNKFISGAYKTQIQGSTTLDKIVNGLRNYIAGMSAGKVLIRP
ncbi:MAG: zinc-binding dehydrogenase [Bacteroidales bacterium]|nr:zinc-binding dehydrogenase [Bacteroidales bacterium]